MDIGDTITFPKRSKGANHFKIVDKRRVTKQVYVEWYDSDPQSIDDWEYKLEGLNKWFTTEEIWTLTRH